MDPESVCEILNELLAAEQAAMTPRLFESTVFVSRLSVAEVPVAQRMARQSRRNCERLTALILEYGGVPDPRRPAPNLAHLHFQDLHYVLPLAMADHESIVRRYEAAAGRLASEPHAAALVNEILESHRGGMSESRGIREGESVARSEGQT